MEKIIIVILVLTIVLFGISLFNCTRKNEPYQQISSMGGAYFQTIPFQGIYATAGYINNIPGGFNQIQQVQQIVLENKRENKGCDKIGKCYNSISSL